MKNREFESLCSSLLFSVNQVHIYHLQTRSYAEHKALQGYYEDVQDLIDTLIESYQGNYGIIDKYEQFQINSYVNLGQIVGYFESLKSNIYSTRKSVKETNLQNDLDSILTLIDSTLYKLKNLN